MKKVLFAAIALVASVVPAMAEENFAPEAGDLSLEIQFNPFSNNFQTFDMERLQATYMLSDKDGLRFGLGLNTKNETVVPAKETENTRRIHTYADFTLNFGYERHFFQYRRIDLYAGVEGIYSHSWAKSVEETQVAGGVNKVETYNKVTFEDDNTFYGGNAVGANLFTGINFSAYKGLYVGAEIGLGCTAQFSNWIYNKSIVDGKTTESNKTDKYTSVTTGFYAVPALRLGWTF